MTSLFTKTTETITVEWHCPKCEFANDEEFTELPETVICGRCGSEFDYDDSSDSATRV